MKSAPIAHQRTYYHPEYVQNLFDGIAHRYDALNHILSGGLDIIWRRKTIDALLKTHPDSVLDVATGTGDVALAAVQRGVKTVTAVDVSDKMIQRAVEKAQTHPRGKNIRFCTARGEELPFENASFDAVTVAFGVRNFTDLPQGLSEIHRVLKPGGNTLILEFSQPSQSLLSMLYAVYLRGVVPALGRLLSSSKEAYGYLADTIGQFPSGDDFLAHLANAGFHDLDAHTLSAGIVTLYSGRKPTP